MRISRAADRPRQSEVRKSSVRTLAFDLPLKEKDVSSLDVRVDEAPLIRRRFVFRQLLIADGRTNRA